MQCENPKILHHLPHVLDTGNEAQVTYHIGKGECLKYVFVPENDGVYERHFILTTGAVFRWGAIILWSNMVLKMSVSIEGSHSEASLQLLGLAKSHTNIEIDGLGNVRTWSENVKLRVDQTNILLGKWARVRGRPVLEVATDSIEWGHSCKIHQISWEKLFYLESHGIEKKSAEQMLLEGEITNHLNIISLDNEIAKWKILSRLLSFQNDC
jgi:SUF system FeS cluster assembly, SufBD